MQAQPTCFGPVWSRPVGFATSERNRFQRQTNGRDSQVGRGLRININIDANTTMTANYLIGFRNPRIIPTLTLLFTNRLHRIYVDSLSYIRALLGVCLCSAFIYNIKARQIPLKKGCIWL